MAFNPNGWNPDLVFLVDIEPGRRLDDLVWTPAGNMYYVDHPEGEPSRIELDGSAAVLSEAASLLLCEATEDSWFYDPATERLYIHLADSAAPAEENPFIVSYRWHHFSTAVETFDGHPYIPILSKGAMSAIDASTRRYHEAGTSFSFGSIKLLNGDGRFDIALDAYIWEAKRLIVRIGELGKGDANYQIVWDGWTGDVEWSDSAIEIKNEDLRLLVV